MDHWNDLREPNSATYRLPSPTPEALLPDDQISELDLSATLSKAVEDAVEMDGFTWPTLASATTAPSDNEERPSEWSVASTHGLPSSYEVPSLSDPVVFHITRADAFDRPYSAPKSKDRHASAALPKPHKAWEDDAVAVDQAKVPRHPDERQQDVAERINALTRQIQNQAQFCVDISKQVRTLANENKHLIPRAASSVSDTLATFVVKPALDLPRKLRTYYPGLSEGIPALKEYEESIKRVLACSANARDMILAQGAVVRGSGSDINRLKDRLVEQDSMLRDSSAHLTRLFKERDALKRKLEEGQRSPTTTAFVSDTPLLAGLGEHPGSTPKTEGVSPDTSPRRRGTEENRKDLNALADQLRELRLVVEELSQVSRQAMPVEATHGD